ncbi:hypothetical protein [Arthrobacter castelli]|uniref:hypothetical protein n=1 Tax=Arthrobacter castelli TaxID=271431 RepID=UPI0004265FF9|nr:hypothetical protein [Arthrobacter castelli]
MTLLLEHTATPANKKTAKPAYTEADRVADRLLCRTYLRQWKESFGGWPAPESGISFTTFAAAADRLAAPIYH